MAKAKAEEPEDKEGDDDGTSEPKARGRRGKVLIGAGVLAVLILAGGAGAYFMGVFGGGEEASGAGGEGGSSQAAMQPPVFFEVPDLVVTIGTGERRATFLKLRVKLDLAKAQDVAQINAVLPRVIDVFQVYLRELRYDDLQGSPGAQRLRIELLRRVNLVVAPAIVKDVLLTELLIQ